MSDDPNWPRASAWLGGDRLPETVHSLAVIGAPIRRGSISGGRFDLAPTAIRRALERFSTFDVAPPRDIRAVAARDEGDLDVADAAPEEALTPLAGAVGGTLDAFDAIAILGGDNSVTRPACRGLGPRLERIGLVTLDAHHDVRDTSGGLTNGNPVRALIDDGLPGRNVVQIGIQPFANSPEYARFAAASGIRWVAADTVRQDGIEMVFAATLPELAARVDSIYVDLDVDVLDRAFAPACPGARPGGLMPWELQTAARLAGAHPKVRAIDIVEVDPERDRAEATAMAAASFVLAFAAGRARRGS